ncbi:MAG: homogentisate phytyltransferase [Bacteroidota bacterium]
MSAFIRFTRPHTIIGTSLSIVALYLLALAYSSHAGWHLDLLAYTLLSCLGANVFIVGLNQLTDVDIDRINKPYLPLASGEYSMRTGYWLVGLSVVVSLAIALWMGGYLLWTVGLSLFLGTIYSLPPIRLKRFHFWAAFCIIAVRGLIVNLLLFLHFHSMINGLHTIPPAVWLLTGTIFIYGLVIAWFKDIPDMEGDSQFSIHTLTLQFGARRVFRIGNGLIILAYLSLMILPIWLELSISAPILVGAHLLFLLLLWIAGRRVQLQERASVFRYYQFIWLLFFLEYISFATAGMVG